MMPFPASWFSPLIVATSLLFVAAPFLVLGLGIQASLFPHLRLARHHLLAASVASVCVVGYALFWLSVLSPVAGHVASFACWCTALAFVVYGPSRRRLGALLGDPDVRWPLLLTLVATFVALELDLAVLPDPLPASWSWGDTARTRFRMFADDILPHAMAMTLFSGRDLASGIFAQQSIERAPLQAGLVLIELPVWDLLGNVPFLDRSWFSGLYRPYGALLQCTWIAAGFAALRGLGLSVRGSISVLGCLLPSYFFLMNSVFVWPKLLAGGLVVSAYAVLLQRDGMKRRPGGLHLAYGATLAGLGMIGHPGVAMSLLAFALLLLAPSRLPRWRDVALAFCVVAGIVGPWLILQNRLLDTPGFLMRRHLISVGRHDPRGALEALRGTYSDFTPSSFLVHKAKQVSLVVGISPAASGRKAPKDGPWDRLRAYQRNSLGATLGLLNTGWLVVVGVWLLRLGSRQSRLQKCGECLLAGLLCTAVWLGLQLSLSVVYHCSYATVILLFIGLAAALACLPRVLGIPLLAAHASASLATALLGWRDPFHLAPVHLLAASLVVLGLAVLLVSRPRS